jgi:hypothetical protein
MKGFDFCDEPILGFPQEAALATLPCATVLTCDLLTYLKFDVGVSSDSFRVKAYTKIAEKITR